MISDSASRATRSRRSLQRATLLFLAVLAGVTVLRAQETAPPAAPTTPLPSPAVKAADKPLPPATASTAAGDTPAAPAATAGAAAAPDAAASSDAGSSGAKEAKPAGKVGPTRDRFEPSEKVRADFDVSFPVDI
jgi:hypothetical protein